MTVALPRVPDGGDNFESLLWMRSSWDYPGGTSFILLGKPVPLDRVSSLTQKSGRTVQEVSRFPTPRHIALAIPPWVRM